jgi:predicted DNA-binding transcriptional regulator AlpA
MFKKSKPQLITRIDGIAREAERRIITGVPTSSWYLLQEKGLAPKPVRLGRRSVGWNREALFRWVEERSPDHKDTWQPLSDPAARVVERVRP